MSNIAGLVVKLDLLYAKRFLLRMWLLCTASHINKCIRNMPYTCL